MEYIGGKLGGPCARRAHAAAQSLGNEHLIVIHGGQDENSLLLDDMWLYDAKRMIWKKIVYKNKEIPTGRTLHTLVSYLPGKFILYGGLKFGNEEELDDCWVFDIIDRTWSRILPVGDFPGKRGGHSAVVGGKFMYLFGGLEKGDNGSVYRLNLHTWKWDKLFISNGPKPAPRESCSSCWIPQFNSLLIAFGQRADVQNEVYCNDIWALVKQKSNADVWYWVKVELDKSYRLAPRIEASMILLPGLKPRVLVWGGLIFDQTQRFADDYLIIDLQDMKVFSECRPDWPNRMLHSAFRVGSEFLVFGGIQMATDKSSPVAAPNRMERFCISFETLYDKKRSQNIRVRVERTDNKVALLSAVVDGKVYLASITHDMVAKAKAKQRTLKFVNDHAKNDAEMKNEIVPAQRILDATNIESLAVKRKMDKLVQRNSGCTSDEVRNSTPKRQRVGSMNSSSAIAKSAQDGGRGGNGAAVQIQSSGSAKLASGRARSAVASAIAPPPLPPPPPKRSQSPGGVQSKKQQTTISFGHSRTKSTTAPVAPPLPPPLPPPKQAQARTASTGLQNRAQQSIMPIAPPRRSEQPKRSQGITSAIAPPKSQPLKLTNAEVKTQGQPSGSERKSNVPSKQHTQTLGLSKKSKNETRAIGLCGNVTRNLPGPQSKSEKGMLESGKLENTQVVDRQLDANKAVSAAQTPRPTNRMGRGFAIAPPKVEIHSISPASKVDSARVSAIGTPKQTAKTGVEESKNENCRKAEESVIDVGNEAVDVEMRRDENPNDMVALEPVPDNVSDLEDLDDDLEPINYEPPSAEELAAASAQIGHDQDRMEVERQLAEDEIEQVEAPSRKAPDIISIE